MAFRRQKIVLIVLQIVAFWAVWRWFALRISNTGDEIYGILALLAVGGFCLKFRAGDSTVSNFNFVLASIAIYVAAYPFAPPLVRAAIAMTSLTFAVSAWRFNRRFHFGVWSLFLLGLPIVASMQFYLGYPLRVAVGEATAFLLKLNGLAVFREGVCLHFGEQLVWIDAPCSGVKMLWAGFFLAALLVTIYEFRVVKSAIAFVCAFVIILLGNVFRATGLFYLEAEIIELPEAAHSAVGVSAFVLTCAAIVFVVTKLKNLSRFEPQTSEIESADLITFSRRQTIVFGLFCLFAFAVPFFVGEKQKTTRNQTSAEFPTHFENRSLSRLDLTEREQFFLRDFPGEIRRFTDGRREIIVRRVTEATRKLHPASDCFSAIGYQIEPLPLKIDASQNKWACFSATKDKENLRVCERIYAENGASWTDVSSWYWSALGDENENYWALTVAEAGE